MTDIVRKRLLTSIVAVAVTGAGGLIGAFTTPASADITNTNATAKRLCESKAAHHDYAEVYVEQKQSFSGPGATTDPDLGTLYVVHLADPRYNTRHCAIAIKGRTDGAHHPMYIDIRAPDSDGFPFVAGDRRSLIGPIYVGHHWDHANASLYRSGNPYTAELKG